MILEEEPADEEEEEEQQSFQPTVKIGAKKQKKLEEKQAKKAQREVRAALQQPETLWSHRASRAAVVPLSAEEHLS